MRGSVIRVVGEAPLQVVRTTHEVIGGNHRQAEFAVHRRQFLARRRPGLLDGALLRGGALVGPVAAGGRQRGLGGHVLRVVVAQHRFVGHLGAGEHFVALGSAGERDQRLAGGRVQLRLAVRQAGRFLRGCGCEQQKRPADGVAAQHSADGSKPSVEPPPPPARAAQQRAGGRQRPYQPWIFVPSSSSCMPRHSRIFSRARM